MPSGSKDTVRKDVAVYIDYENLYISLRSTVGKNPNFDVIMDKCREFGRLTILRAYADWSEFARVVTIQLFASGVEPIYVPTRKFYDAKTRSQATKNSVDIHITIDIMKMLTSDGVDSFVLVSGDRDFVPLMNQIRAAGKEVYAIGVAGCTSSELSLAVDEMFYYHQLLESDEELATEQRDVYQKLMRAVEIARARGYRATLGVIKPLMRELVVGFDERKFRNPKGVPFQKFKELCEEAERQGFIRLAEAADGVELFLAKDNVAELLATSASQARRPEGRSTERSEPRRADRADRPERPEPRRTERAARPEPRRAPADGANSDGGAVGDAAIDDAAVVGDSGAEGESSTGDPADGSAEGSTGRGRRRGRRGGRGRGRRGRGEGGEAGEGSADPADADADADADSDDAVASGGDEAADRTVSADHVSGNGSNDAEDDSRGNRRSEATDASPSRGRRPARAAEAPAPAPAPVRRPVESDDDDEDGDGDELPVGEAANLPAAAFDDLRGVMRSFEGRAPSQRRLIKQLKKEAADGDLKGEYKDGQFLLLVRKAIQEGVLEKISKGFYSGLRLKGEGGAEIAAD